MAVSKPKLDVKEKPRFPRQQSPIDEILDDDQGGSTEPQEDRRQIETEFQYHDPFAQLDRDFPQYCNPTKVGPKKLEESCKYPDLLLVRLPH